MLFAIIGTIDRGNFVFDRWPRAKQFPKIKSGITTGDLSQKLTQYFYYFGIFRKNAVFETSQSSFSESCLIEIFNANQKRLEVVLGIDDQCVMVSRSIFIVNNEKLFTRNSMVPMNSNLYIFEDIDQEKKDIVNSITLVWRAQKFEEVESVKNKLSFIIGVLSHMEQSQDFLSKQIIKITEAKDNFERKLKQKCQELNKDPSIMLQEFKVKEMFQQFYDLAEEQIRDIEIFKQLSKFYDCCVNGIEYTASTGNWYGSIGSDFQVPIHKNNVGDRDRRIYKGESKTDFEMITKYWPENIYNKWEEENTLYKTTLATQKKLQSLPRALRDERIHRLYNSALKINDLSLEQVIAKQKSLSQNGALQTIQFLKLNNAGLSVYPFDLKKYYNLYTLRKMPSWPLIKKFNTKIFPRDNILKEIHPFSKFKRINMLDEKLKYIILQNIIKEVYVYIYYLDYVKSPELKDNQVRHFRVDQDEEGQENSSEIQISKSNSQLSNTDLIQEQNETMYEESSKADLLMNFVNKPYNLNEILHQESEFESISQILKLVIEKMDKKKQVEKEREKEKQMNRKKIYKITSRKELSSPHKSVGNKYQNQNQGEVDSWIQPKWGFYYVQKF